MSEASVYRLRPVIDMPGYACFAVSDMKPTAHGFTFLTDFNPRNVSTRTWQMPRLAPLWRTRKVIDPLPGQANDYPCIGLRVPTFSERAVNALRDLLELNGELLPLECDTGAYYAYNVTTVADVLDREQSDIKWRPLDVLRKQELVVAEQIRHYEFRPDALLTLSIFRIPEDIVGYYVTHLFARRVREHDLRGLNLQKVWPLPRPRQGSVAEMERRANRHDV